MAETKPPESEKQLEIRISGELADFFETEPIEAVVTIHDSKDSLDKSWHEHGNHSSEEQAPDWLVAYATNGVDIHILSPATMPAGDEANGYLRFQKVLKHELAHLYIRTVNTQLPFWLQEGVCLYVAEQSHYKKLDPSALSIDLLHELDDAPTDVRMYLVGRNMVDQIVDNYGKKKLFEIMALQTQDERYAELKRMFAWLK